jgi:transposase-like protein
MHRESQVEETGVSSRTASSGDSGNGEERTRRVPSAGVPAKPQRRQFTADFKTRIVEEADACTQAGEVTALLRREGLYSSHLANWRRQYRRGAAVGLATRRGPKGKDPLVLEKEELERKVARLEHRLQQAEKIIEVQKKLSELLGIQMPDSGDR